MFARKHRIGAGIAAAGVLLGCLAGAAAPASAQGTPPPWAPNGVDQDQNAIGGITFYDSSGAAITTGTTSSAPFAAYAVGGVEPRSGNVKATLFFYVPQVGQTPDLWSTNAQVGVATTYPNSSAPDPVKDTTLPVNSASSSDQSLDHLSTSFPNTSTQSGYQNVYEIRMYTSAPKKPAVAAYDYADISINSTNHTWSLVYSPVTSPVNTAPGAPTSVQAVAGNAQATVSWTAPADNGGATISGYHVQYSTDSGGTWTDGPASAQTSTATSATVTGLTNGTAYEFRVAAINSVGSGDYSAASNAVTPQPPTAPGAPTSVQAVAGNAQATVSWTAPADNGGATISGYHVQYSTDSGGTWTDGPASAQTSTATSATVTGLTNGTAYEFRVAAINSVGAGAFSTGSAPATPVAPTVPGVPSAPQATAGNQSATVSWTTPASDGGAAITGYDLEYSADSGANWASVSPSFHTSTATTGRVSGLSNGTAYEFRVAAINSVGTGAYSAASAAVTPTAPALDNSKVSITASRTVKYGTTTSISGTLIDTRTNTAIAGQRVALYGRRGSAAFKLIGTVSTSSRGVASIRVKPAGTEQFEWVFSGTVTHWAATSAVSTVRVKQAVAAHVTAKRAEHGKKVRFYGTVSPNAKGKRVVLQIFRNGKWKNVGSAVVHKQKMPNKHTATGFLFSYRLPKGATKCRVHEAARSGLAQGDSATITVRGT